MRNQDILDSWKDISDYLEKDIRTCRRWQIHLGLPIHRIDENSSHSKVFAFKSEIDQWLREKGNNKNNHANSPSVNKNRAIIILSLLVVSLFIAFIFVFKSKNSAQAESVSRIAVMPFKFTSIEEHNEYIPEGISNELIRLLNRRGKISAFQTKLFEQPQTNASVHLGQKSWPSEFILSGDVKKERKDFIFDIQLTQTKNGEVIYKDTINCKPQEIFSIPSNIYQHIIEKLGLGNAQKTPFGVTGTLDGNAFNNYLKGSFILSRIDGQNGDPWKLYYKGKYLLGSYTRESNELAINFFKEAIKLDKNFARAYVGLANCYANYVNYNWDFNEKWLEKAKEFVKKAQIISTDYPEYYMMVIQISLINKLAFGIDSSFDICQFANEGIQKFPNDPELNSMTGYCYMMKYGKEGNRIDLQKAIDYKEKSLWLNPPSLDNLNYVEILMLIREFYKAIEVCKILEQHNSSILTQFRLGEIYYYLGDLNKSSHIFSQFYETALDVKVDSLLFLGMIASQRGMQEEALRIIDEIINTSPGDLIINEDLKMASIYLGIGNKKLGFECLRTFFSKTIAREIPFVFQDYVSIDKNFDNFKEDEEFQNIINLRE